MPNKFRTVPLEIIEDTLRSLWKQDMPDTDILERLRAHHIPKGYTLGIKKLRKMREELGLLSVRKQAHTLESITAAVTAVRQMFPRAGRRDIRRLLEKEHGLRVSRSLFNEWAQLYEPDLVRQRKAGKMRRRRFFAAGCHDLWCCDQHDKWKRFGLGVHVCLDPFTGRIIWLKIWWGNRNPYLIFGYYLEAVRRLGYTCLVGQGDPGSENWCFAKGHTFIRHALDPGLEGTIQFRFMRRKKNIAPEIFWSNFRSRFTPGFEDILDAPLRHPQIRYDPADSLQYNVFKWIFIPWLQLELDGHTELVNTTKKRYQRNKILPQGGCPYDIDTYPEMYGVTNFKIMVDRDAPCLKEAEELYAPRWHPTFELVPDAFDKQAEAWYNEEGRPQVNRHNVWDIYMKLLTHFETHPELITAITLSPQPEEEKEGAGNDFVPDCEGLFSQLEDVREMARLAEDAVQCEGDGAGFRSENDRPVGPEYDEEAGEPFLVDFTDDEWDGRDPLATALPSDSESE